MVTSKTHLLRLHFTKKNLFLSVLKKILEFLGRKQYSEASIKWGYSVIFLTCYYHNHKNTDCNETC